jgi:dihydrodipicolinate synthase/N-acetylneuraminate lyase
MQPSSMPLIPVKTCREIHGICAAYLPWRPVGRIDFDSYAMMLESIWRSGLIPAVNMDTGFANLLTDNQRREVLQFAKTMSQGRPMVAGVFVDDLPGDCLPHYQRQVEATASEGAMPILFQCRDLVRRTDREIVKIYDAVGKLGVDYLGFELGTMFANFGAIYSIECFTELIAIPQLLGLKHSSLSREMEWQRLEIRDARRPEFRVYTGNDLAIDMVQWGSDYLLGLAAFFPEAFALRDRYWSEGDRRFYALNDALQLLGGFSFRAPVPAYKHNAAMALALRGVIGCDAMHPEAPSRPPSDREFIAMMMDRIQGLMSNAV